MLVEMTHVITDIQPRSGTKPNPQHAFMVGRPCVVLDLQFNQPAWLAVEMYSDPGHLHRFITTPVADFAASFDGFHRYYGQIVIQTHNSLYVLDEITEGRVLCESRFDWDNFKKLV